MCYSAKSSLSAWIIISLISLMLWYRNEAYDRALAPFIFTLGLVQLIEYGIHSTMNPEHGAKLLFITLWLQCFIFALSVYVLAGALSNEEQLWLTRVVSGILLAVFLIVFAASILYVLTTEDTFNASVGSTGHIEWNRGTTTGRTSLLGWWSVLYLLGIFAPLLILLAMWSWTDIGLWILLAYGVGSAFFVWWLFPPEAFSSMWCYLVVGFAFLAWMVGIFQ
jgi:hypothetical protein